MLLLLLGTFPRLVNGDRPIQIFIRNLVDSLDASLLRLSERRVFLLVYADLGASLP
jgi:hypothetical protein